jgi:hypothetical protein
LSSPCHKKSENNTVDASKQFIQKSKYGKRLTSLQKGDAVKCMKLEQSGISTAENTEIQKVDFDKNSIHTSSCRGKSEGVVGWAESCVFSSHLSIELRVRWKHDLEKCVDASPCFIKYKR